MSWQASTTSCGLIVKRSPSLPSKSTSAKSSARVREWVVANRDTVKEVFLAPRGQRNLILAVMKGQSHDSDLEDRLSELDLEIARDERVRVFEFDTMAVPDCGEESVTAFLPRIPE